MNLLLAHKPPSPPPNPLLKFSCIYKPQKTSTQNIKTTQISIPARDRVIDFGKHKGKLLGTLPSTYLKWVSKNLRARDFEDWAKLADQVLNDPVYRDRLEWEFAEKLLNGTVSSSISAVSELVDISERFGWDNEDKLGWKRIDFKLLGTSKGGRIPRVSRSDDGSGAGGVEREVGLKREEVRACDEGSRGERREIVRLKLKRGVGSELGSSDEVMELGIGGDHEVVIGCDQDQTMEKRSRFPGREALLKKALNRGRL